MDLEINTQELIKLGLDSEAAAFLLKELRQISLQCDNASQAWQLISRYLLHPKLPFSIHLFLFSTLYPHWHTHPESAPAWLPQTISSANISRFMEKLGMQDVKTFHAFSIQKVEAFWEHVVNQLQIVFDTPYQKICDLSHGIESPNWFLKAAMNITNSCFHANPDFPAIIYEDNNKHLIHLSYRELNRLSNRAANSLQEQGWTAGDAIAIAMPMTHYAVAIYLGIIKMGGVVVSIADSFSAEEIASRLTISRAKAIFTQDNVLWSGKKIPLYEKIKKTSETLPDLKIIVLPAEDKISIPLQDEDSTWEDFLSKNDEFTAVSCSPMSACNILFSSGTTGEPKAIVWNHTTPIKAASDAFFHQNIQPGDVLAWPTNLGWMMGPWLIFAALINQAAIALYPDSPKDKNFGEFVERAEVTMLGVVPTLAAVWRQSHCMEKLDWHTIKVFSSTGECSNPEDMLYLMSLAGYKPVIEYCGGTEIGGAYLSSTVVQPNYPALFTTPAMGMDIRIVDEEGHPAETGEAVIVPPSLGLSTTLLNADHYQVYFADMPRSADGRVLRRHGDFIKKYPSGLFSILGRVDDTMNLGGIKTSAADIERALAGVHEKIIETAAIAVNPPHNGPSLLVIYAASAASLDKTVVMQAMQRKINTELNPLFKIHDLIFTDTLPKTASNKIMRRVLRQEYLALKNPS